MAIGAQQGVALGHGARAEILGPHLGCGDARNDDEQSAPQPTPSTKHPKAKIVGIALGHDARTHDLKPYQQLLINAAKWTSGKK